MYNLSTHVSDLPRKKRKQECLSTWRDINHDAQVRPWHPSWKKKKKRQKRIFFFLPSRTNDVSQWVYRSYTRILCFLFIRVIDRRRKIHTRIWKVLPGRRFFLFFFSLSLTTQYVFFIELIESIRFRLFYRTNSMERKDWKKKLLWHW